MSTRQRILVLSVLLMAAPCAAQTTRKVPSQYATIQRAIDASSSGDIVLVAKGTYRENISFKGRNIAVRSEAGPAMTVIQAATADRVVTIAAGETRAAVLEGFTIERGQAVQGAGIYCWRSSPTIRRNVIKNNRAKATTGSCQGGGIYCRSGAPLIDGNRIVANAADARGTRNTVTAYGGGIYLADTQARIVNNVIVGNEVHSSGLPPFRVGVAFGGGVYTQGGAVSLTNNTIVANTCYMTMSVPGGLGGGVYVMLTTLKITNSILRGNLAHNNSTSAPSQIAYGLVPAAVTWSNVQGGHAGQGNFDLDAKLTATHALTLASPCRDRGSASAPDLPATDHEGDPRIVYGRPDVGADEFNQHLTSSGVFMPGQAIQVRVVGPPRAAVLWAFTTTVAPRNPPLWLPGAGNPLWLADPFLLFPLGAVGANGELVLRLTIPTSTPVPLTVHHQAAVGAWLTNRDTMRITR